MASLMVKESAFGVLRFHLWAVVCVRAALGQCTFSAGWNVALRCSHTTRTNVFLKNVTSCITLSLFLLSAQRFTPFISVHTDQIIYSYCTSADVMRIRAPVTVILINITPAFFLSDQLTAKCMMLLKINVAARILPVLKHNLDYFGFRNNKIPDTGGRLG